MLELDDLRKRYGATVALDGLGFTAAHGRMLGFVGPNGAGKTTAMRAIFGLVRLDSGQVRWRDAPVDAATRQRFGYMPEERGLYPRMRTHEQVRYFAQLHGLDARAASRAADEWLDRLGLAERGLDPIEQLSHGNQQRVQLAVAMVHQADVLVLDEPFAGLDPIGVQTLGALVREEARRGAAVVFSSHQLNLVEDLCDDVAIVQRGRVVLAGPLAELRAASPYRYVEIVRAGAPGAAPPAELPASLRAEPVERLERGDRLRVPRDTDPRGVLEAASAHGALASFRFEPPSLEDLFMEAVGR